MIKELSDALRRLVNSLSVRPLSTLAALFIICLTFICVKSYNRLEDLIITPDEEATRFKEQLESSKLVNESIEQLRRELQAVNVVIRQFHNGRHDLTGIPFTESSATFYTENYEDIGDEAIASMNGTLRRIWKRIDQPECLVLNAPVDPSSKKYFRSYGLTKVIECPLTNLLNYPVGTITVGFSEGDTPDNIAVQKTEAIAKRVTGYLTNGY